MAAALNCQSKSASVLLSREAGLADAVGDAPLAAPVGLLADQHPQEFQVRQPLALGARQHGVELLGPQGNAAAPGSPQGSAGAASVGVGVGRSRLGSGSSCIVRLRLAEVLVVRRRPGGHRVLVQPGGQLPPLFFGQRLQDGSWAEPGPTGCVPRPRGNTRRTARPAPARRSGPTGRRSPTAPAPAAPGPCRNAEPAAGPPGTDGPSRPARRTAPPTAPAVAARPRGAGAPCARSVARWPCAATARAGRSPRPGDRR